VGTFLKIALATALAGLALMAASVTGSSALTLSPTPLNLPTVETTTVLGLPGGILGIFNETLTPADPAPILGAPTETSSPINATPLSDGTGTAPGTSSDQTSPDGQAKPNDEGKLADELAPPAPPVVRKRFNVKSAAGTVRVRTPGSDHFVTLAKDAQLPVGSLVNTGNGAVTLTAASDDQGGTQTATFFGSVFAVHQTRGAHPITELALKGRQLRSCHATSRKASASRRRPSRRLWGRGKGRFRTRGRNSAASVRGTIWLTQDRCNGTLTRVERGEVRVRDFARKRNVVVRTGGRYFAKARR
jgi:hypothetical protein